MSPFTPRFDHFNPFDGNEFRTRADVDAGLKSLIDPLEVFRSPGGARVRLDSAGAHFDIAAADVEGFSRPLWGLAPAQIGGSTWINWEPIARGLANATDPKHPEFWGVPPADYDQRLVEMAAIGLSLRLVPEKIWDPLTDTQKDNLVHYLKVAREFEHADNNWKFFRLMVDMGLKSVGAKFNAAPGIKYRDELEGFYVGDGWYRDGQPRQIDHYIPFAFHFYGLLLAKLDDKTEFTERYRERARLFTKDMARWYADDGGCLAFGRSMTYRFANAGFWGALALADEEVLPWGELKGYFLRHLRWWKKLPFASRDGTMAVGYGYPNLLMSENYNSGVSPYWALKAFLPLALPDSHPFWTAEEVAAPTHDKPSVQKHPGFVIANPPGDAIALSSGQQNQTMRFGAEKYAKFAYSARYAYSVESDERKFFEGVYDSSIGFSDDNKHGRTRETNEVAMVADATLYARWRPFADVLVESWTYWDGPFQVRVHRIDTPRPLHSIEGGFAVPRPEPYDATVEDSATQALIETTRDLSAILDLGSSLTRSGLTHKAPPNTNLIAPKTMVPQLRVTLPAGKHVLACAVIAEADQKAVRSALKNPPAKPDLTALEKLVRDKGVQVSAMTGLADR